MNKTLFILFIFTISFYSCKRNTSSTQNQITTSDMKINIPSNLLIEKDQILKRLEVQLSWQDMDETDPNYFNITKEDIIIGGKINYEGFLKKRFNSINEDIFKKRVKDYFGFDLDKSNVCKYLYDEKEYSVYIVSGFTNEPDEARIESSLDFQRDNFYFVKNKNFMLKGVPLMSGSLEDKDDGTTDFKIWDNEYHRNKFLFNDDQKSLSWLLHNDLDFLEQLIKEFGYDKNQKINRAILNKIFRDYENQQNADKTLFVDLFAKKDCHEKLQIRKDLVKYITDNTTIEDNELLEMLEDYASELIEEQSDNNNCIQNGFTYAERLQIFTILGFEIEKIYEKFEISVSTPKWDSASCFYNKLIDENLVKEIESNNYYNIAGLRDMIKNIQQKREVD